MANSTKIKRILIAGEWFEASESIVVKSPFSGETVAECSSLNAAEFQRCIDAAENAARAMKKLGRFEIAKSLRLISEGIAARREEFARTIALESGKPLTLARGEAERAAASFAWAAGEAERFTGEIIPVDTQAVGRGKTAWTLRVPRGIIYGITPFNFPLNLVAHKVAPALAARNSIVIKPSPRTPLTALLLGEVFLESGLPKSALQIAPMDVKYIGEVFSDDRISMISFTGSASVGWEIKRLANKKFTALELGGNAAVIVDESANFERSVSRSVTGAFAYSGQVCISVQRIYVHEKLFDDWLADFARRSHELIFGDPLDETTQISAMIDESAAIRAEEWIKEAIGNGAKLVSGGKRSGAIMEPSILTNTTPEMRVVSEEVFAPVAVVERFSEFAQAVEMVNVGKYGLQAGVFTGVLAHAEFASENLEVGGVIINDAPIFRVDNMPYGGVKDSGFGREGIRYAMEEMSELRLVVMNP